MFAPSSLSDDFFVARCESFWSDFVKLLAKVEISFDEEKEGKLDFCSNWNWFIGSRRLPCRILFESIFLLQTTILHWKRPRIRIRSVEHYFLTIFQSFSFVDYWLGVVLFKSVVRFLQFISTGESCVHKSIHTAKYGLRSAHRHPITRAFEFHLVFSFFLSTHFLE